MLYSRLDSGPALQARARLIKCNVPIRPNATQKQLDASCTSDLLFICNALLFQIFSITIQNVDIRGIDIYVAEEMLVHEAVVRLRVFALYAHVLVHVEGDDISKGDFALFVRVDQILVNALGR